jgi:hypothetical protein
MRNQTVSSRANQPALPLRRLRTVAFAPGHDPRLEALTALSVIALLSLGLGSAVSLAVFVLSSTVW